MRSVQSTMAALVGACSSAKHCLSRGTLDSVGSCFSDNLSHVGTTTVVDTGTSRVIGATKTALFTRMPRLVHPNNGTCAAHHCTTYLQSVSCCLHCNDCTLITNGTGILSRQMLTNLHRACGTLNIPVNPAIINVRVVGSVIGTGTTRTNIASPAIIRFPFSCVYHRLDRLDL